MEKIIMVWLIILVVGIATFAIRLSFIWLWGRQHIPQRLQQALRFVPAAALSAIIVPDVMRHSGSIDISLSNARLLATIIAAGVAWRTRNVVWTIAAGMVSLLALQALLHV
jgi:branched-subunit amino acid transport protein